MKLFIKLLNLLYLYLFINIDNTNTKRLHIFDF